MIRAINTVQTINAQNITNNIINPSPGPCSSDGDFAIIPMTEPGMTESENAVANAANASLRFVKLWFVTIAEIKKAINTSKNIIPISNVCYIHLIYSPIKPYGTIKDARVKATAAIFIGVVWAFSIMYAQRIKNAVFAINMSGAVEGD